MISSLRSALTRQLKAGNIAFRIQSYGTPWPTRSLDARSLMTLPGQGLIASRPNFPLPMGTRFVHKDFTPSELVEERNLGLTIALIAFVTGTIAYNVYWTKYELAAPRKSLNPDKYLPFSLIEILPVSDDTSIFRFEAANIGGEHRFPACSHVSVKDDSMQVQRPYTPVSIKEGHFDLLVKRYPEGSVSPWIHSKKVGETVEIRGPVLTFPYERNSHKEIGMIAGGTGIAPMFQLIRRILNHPDDHSRVSLIYANKTEKDILLKEQLDTLASLHPERFSVFYTIDQPSSGESWLHGTGFVDEDMVKAHLPLPDKGSDVLLLVCGPRPMIKHVSGLKLKGGDQGDIGGVLKDVGYVKDQVYKL